MKFGTRLHDRKLQHAIISQPVIKHRFSYVIYAGLRVYKNEEN